MRVLSAMMKRLTSLHNTAYLIILKAPLQVGVGAANTIASGCLMHLLLEYKQLSFLMMAYR